MSFGPEYGITEIPGLYYFHGYTFQPVAASLAPMILALTVAFLITWVACMEVVAMSAVYYDARTARPSEGRELEAIANILDHLGHHLNNVYRLVFVNGSVWVWQYLTDGFGEFYIGTDGEPATELIWHCRETA